MSSHSHSPEDNPPRPPLGFQASSPQMSIDADRGSHDVSSVPRPIGEETPRQSLVAKDVGHAVHEPPGSSPIQPVVPATAEGHSAANEETSPSSNPNDAPAESRPREDEVPEVSAPVSAANPHSNPSGHSVLGLKTKHSLAKPQNPSQPGYMDPHDYEKKYPEDTTYEELSENARIWRVYLDEATEFDADMVNKASDGLDLLLVFAGLFSAVLTTFVVQTSQSLSNDDAAVSVSLLSELVMIQRAMANGTSIESIPPAETTSGPSRSDVWVNGLWFISLTLSLSTALLAVLARQWLHQYTAITSGTPRDRSLIRQYRYEGLTKWRVQVLISLLPVLLHIALGLFLVGLIVFLMPLNPAIAWTVAVITCLVYLIYMISNILPVVDPQCPYRTPFSDILYVISRRLVPSLLTPLWSSILHTSQVARQLATLFGLPDRIIRRATSGSISTLESLSSEQPEEPSSTPGARSPWQPLKEIERQTANTEDVGARAIAWLLKSTSNPPTTSIALQSLGGSSPAMTKMLPGLMLPLETDKALSKAISQILLSDPHQETSSETLRLERLFRSLASICPSPRMGDYYVALLGRPSFLGGYSFSIDGPWISNIVSSDIPLNAKLSLMAKPCAYILRMRPTKGNLPLKEAIFLGILEPQPGTLLLPQDLWNALQEIPGSLYFPEVSQQMLVDFYRNAFEPTSASSVKRDGKFLLEPTSAPRDFMGGLAMLFAYRFHEKDEVREWTVEANLKALLFISEDLQTSGMTSCDYSDHMVEAWGFTVSRCVDIVGTDGTITVPPDLSASLSKDAASILSDSRLLSDTRKLLEAVWKLNHEFEFLTYQELFRDFQNLPHNAAYVWAFALRENREPAYTWFIKLDILSHLSSQSYKLDCRLWSVLPDFVGGISRLSSSHIDECRKYLFQSEHLFTACVGLCYATKNYALYWGFRWNLVRSLVSLDPRHPSWVERIDYLHRYVDAESPLAPESRHDDIRDVFRFIDKCLETHQGNHVQTQLAAAEPTTTTPSKELPSGDHSSGQPQCRLGFLHRVWSRLFGNGIKTPQSDAEQGEGE